uniref:Palmitoyl-protein thioesterase 1 n=1 Tax=Cacopsylla melanoneura TaxID=428564 RepID=A0A8D8UP94_9HEMI
MKISIGLLTLLLVSLVIATAPTLPPATPTLPPASPTVKKYTPIVMWHGMGDSCCNPFSLGHFSKFLDEQLPHVYVKSLQIGDGIVQDTENGFFMNVNEQVSIACSLVANDTQLEQGYNAIGFSQGGLFLRALAQRCPNPPMLNLISVGGPHQGVYGLPHCMYPSHEMCDYVRRVLNVGAYWSWIQDSFVQAEYWHDPMNEAEYSAGSVFLADINNEKNNNTTYRDNLLRLRKLVLIKFEDDSMVLPKDSEWFGFYAPGQGKVVLPLQQTKLYLEDRIGLKTLYEGKRLDLLSSPGDHLRFTKEWFIQNVIHKYLN